MSKHKSEGKDKKKASQLVLRIDKVERDAFVMLCEQLDTSAAREIRRFMRDFVSAKSGEDPISYDEMENDVIVDASGGEPVSEVATSQEPDEVAYVLAGKTEKPKKQQKRVRL